MLTISLLSPTSGRRGRAHANPWTSVLRSSLAPAAILAFLSPRLAPAQSVNANLWVTNGVVNAMTTVADTLYVGGSFTRVQPITGGGVPLDLTTGAVVAGFPRVHGRVFAAIS